MIKNILLFISFIFTFIIFSFQDVNAMVQIDYPNKNQIENEFCTKIFYEKEFEGKEFIDDVSLICKNYWKRETEILIKQLEDEFNKNSHIRLEDLVIFQEF